jgi:hypothetical protein
LYCETKEPFTSVSIRLRSDIVRGARVVIDGSREINSGIKLGGISARNEKEKGLSYPYFTKSMPR